MAFSPTGEPTNLLSTICRATSCRLNIFLPLPLTYFLLVILAINLLFAFFWIIRY